MNGLFGRSLLKGLFLVFSLHARCQEDSVSQIADTRLRTSGFRTFLMGKNYRDEWTTPVKAPILDLKSLNITSLKEGGGKETRSLHIEEDSAKKFDLRSVEKFPEKAVPDALKETAAQKLVEDGMATFENVDAVMEATGFKMGPFKLMDLIGIDINLAVTESLYRAFDEATRFEPSSIQVEKVKKNELGKKTGKGFYIYQNK